MLIAGDFGIVRTPTTDDERGYALVALAILRGNDIPDTEILEHYTKPMPRADLALELAYYQENGVRIRAARVKLCMRQLLVN
jgi:hypothetical protein